MRKVQQFWRMKNLDQVSNQFLETDKKKSMSKCNKQFWGFNITVIIMKLPSRVENALITNVKVDGNRKGWSVAIENKSCKNIIKESHQHLYNSHNIKKNKIKRKHILSVYRLYTSPIAAKVCSWSGDWFSKLSKKNWTDLLTYKEPI